MKISFLLVLAGTRFSAGESTPRPPTKSLSLEQDVMFRHHASNVRSQSSNIEDIAITVNGKKRSLVCTFFITLSPTLLHLFLTFPRHCPCPLPLKWQLPYVVPCLFSSVTHNAFTAPPRCLIPRTAFLNSVSGFSNDTYLQRWTINLTPNYVYSTNSLYVIVQFYPWFRFYFPLFLVRVIYGNEFETKENKI